jgi:hypothetical protein
LILKKYIENQKEQSEKEKENLEEEKKIDSVGESYIAQLSCAALGVIIALKSIEDFNYQCCLLLGHIYSYIIFIYMI